MVPLPASKEASSGAGALGYERHRPERVLLYQLVEEYYHAVKAQLTAHGMELQASVEREFEQYLSYTVTIPAAITVSSCNQERL